MTEVSATIHELRQFCISSQWQEDNYQRMLELSHFMKILVEIICVIMEV